MTADNEETLAPISEGSTIEGARSSRGSLMEEEGASSAEEKKEATPDEDNVDTSLPYSGDRNNLDDDGDNSLVHDTSDSAEDNTGDGERPCWRWADVLSTPASAAVFTPAADINSLKQNMHGWGKQADDLSSLCCI